MPPFISDLLALLHILLVYGRHLALTLDNRAAARGFATIAQFFGTARLEVIRARLARGLLRIQALQRVLLDRAKRGRDLKALKPRQPAQRKPPQPADQSTETKPPRRRPPRRIRDLEDIPDLDCLPTLAQLEAQIRRYGIGRGLADICRDLGVSVLLCEKRFANILSDMLEWYRGNPNRLFLDQYHRRLAYDEEWGTTWGLERAPRTKEETHSTLGFFIGERWPLTPPWVAACPGSLRAVEATGPP